MLHFYNMVVSLALFALLMNHRHHNIIVYFLVLTRHNELSIPPANDTFFHVMMTACFGMNVSAPTTPSRMSHITRSRISTPNRSVRVCKSRSILQNDGNEKK